MSSEQPINEATQPISAVSSIAPASGEPVQTETSSTIATGVSSIISTLPTPPPTNVPLVIPRVVSAEVIPHHEERDNEAGSEESINESDLNRSEIARFIEESAQLVRQHLESALVVDPNRLGSVARVVFHDLSIRSIRISGVPYIFDSANEQMFTAAVTNFIGQPVFMCRVSDDVPDQHTRYFTLTFEEDVEVEAVKDYASRIDGSVLSYITEGNENLQAQLTVDFNRTYPVRSIFEAQIQTVYRISSHYPFLNPYLFGEPPANSLIESIRIYDDEDAEVGDIPEPSPYYEGFDENTDFVPPEVRTHLTPLQGTITSQEQADLFEGVLQDTFQGLSGCSLTLGNVPTLFQSAYCRAAFAKELRKLISHFSYQVELVPSLHDSHKVWTLTFAYGDDALSALDILHGATLVYRVKGNPTSVTTQIWVQNYPAVPVCGYTAQLTEFNYRMELEASAEAAREAERSRPAGRGGRNYY